MEIASIIASIVSMVLAAIAIALSVFFYTQSKNTESNVNKSLEAIKTQTDALQKLTGRWMDRLTKYVTTPKDSELNTQWMLFDIIKDLPKDIASHLNAPTSATQQAQLLNETVSTYCALYYYTAIANYWAQFSLPPLEDFDDNPDLSQFVKEAVDSSYKDFITIAQILQRVDQSVLEASPLKHLVDKTVSQYKNLAADSTMVYAKRAERASL